MFLFLTTISKVKCLTNTGPQKNLKFYAFVYLCIGDKGRKFVYEVWIESEKSKVMDSGWN
jgi:hypothetical protein